ncbi:MAG: nucleotidyltransferase [Sediminibacterium sp.]|nr:nucleotidyltransferase [Sediminibacterium sp.]
MRFTKKKLYGHIRHFLEDLEKAGYTINKVILFGSYANGYPDDYSDIDLAVWSPMFSDDGFEEKDKIRPLLQKYTPLQLHPYPSGETVADDPFIGEIERTGIVLDSPLLLGSKR